MRHIVVGTAGHIDHGKSALVEALTGVHPDRLKEEQRRGITIELGFADLDLAPHGVVSIIDVPGHERFVRHMVAGASGIDALVLVVALDEGVKPQTKEHLVIGDLLGLDSGIVVLSKADLVDADIRDVVALEVRDLVRSTFLEGAPVIEVSARTGEGLSALRDALGGLLSSRPERSANGVARLPIDRSFVLKGFGTVVTGTLMSGILREGQDVVILPGNRRARVRGLQVHKRKVLEARAGGRVAVNLQGVECAHAPRGATVTVPGGLLATRRARVRVQLLPTAPARLRRGGPVRFHQGTCERASRLKAVGPGDVSRFEADLMLAEETVLLPGDRFILRRPAPVDTVGGGLVIDAHPVGRRARVDSTFDGDPTADAWLDRIARGGIAGRSPQTVAMELGTSADDTDAAVQGLIRAGRVIQAGGLLFDEASWRHARDSVLGSLEDFHRVEPLKAGVSRETLRVNAARGMPLEAFREFLQSLVNEGLIAAVGDRVAIAGFEVVLSPADGARLHRIEDLFRSAGLNPPDAEAALSEVGGPSGAKLLELLVERGRLVKIRDGRLFHAEALEDLRRRLRAYGSTSSTIDVGAFKDLAGVTRKNAIPLLEQFDQERLTRREGNSRRILTDEAAG